jgi:Nuclease-related domain
MDRETGPEPTTIRPAQPAGSQRTPTRAEVTAPRPAGPGQAADDDPLPASGTGGPGRGLDRAANDTSEFFVGQATAGQEPAEADADEAGYPDDAPQLRRVGFPSRLIMAQLAIDPRVPIWTRRAVAALVIGVGFTLWLGWRTGLTIAALAAIADTIYQSKTVSLIPAAARVASAQRRTRHRLLLTRPWGYHALHARPIPGTESIIDHLVVGPGGVYAIDSERWDRRLPVRTVASNSAAGPVLYHGPFSQRDRLAHARWEAAQAAYLLSRELRQPVIVRPAMVIYGPAVPWSVARLRGVDVMGGRSVVRYLASRKKVSPDTAVTWERAGEIAAAAERALRPG